MREVIWYGHEVVNICVMLIKLKVKIKKSKKILINH